MLLLLLAAALGDGVLSQSAATPGGGGGLSLSWSSGGANARDFGMSWSDEMQRFLPAVSWRQPLWQRAGLDVSLGVRLRPLGGEDLGQEIDGDLLLARAVGRALLLLDGAVGKGIGARGDVDYDVAGFAGWQLSPRLRAGFEARVQGELVDEVRTADDAGRAVDFTAGSSFALFAGPFSARLLAGFRAPRGLERAGPAAVLSGGLDF